MTLTYTPAQLGDEFTELFGGHALELEMLHYGLTDTFVEPYNGGTYSNLFIEGEWSGRVIDHDDQVRLVNDNNFCNEVCSLRTATLATFLLALAFFAEKIYDRNQDVGMAYFKIFEDLKYRAFDHHPDAQILIRFLD